MSWPKWGRSVCCKFKFLHLIHLNRMDYSILINWANLFNIWVCVVFLFPINETKGLNGLNPGFLERGFIVVRFADFIYFFFYLYYENEIICSHRQNYFIFMGYIKNGGREGVQA